MSIRIAEHREHAGNDRVLLLQFNNELKVLGSAVGLLYIDAVVSQTDIISAFV